MGRVLSVMTRRVPAVWAALVLIPVALVGAGAQQPGAPIGNPTGPVEFRAGQVRYRVVPLVTGLSHPWSIGFLPDGTLLVTEQEGRLRIVRDGVLDPSRSGTAPSAPAAVDPTANNARCAPWPCIRSSCENRLVYVSYPKCGERGDTLAVARGRLDGGTLADVREIFVADAWETSGNLGGRMLFGPDGTLYVTVGDRDRLCCTGTEDNSLRMKAQELDNHVGKTLRLTRRRQRAAGQSVRRPAGREAGDLHLRPPQRLRPRVPPARPASCGRPRSGRWAATRSTSSCPATTTAGRSCRWGATTRARSCPTSPGRGPAWTTRGCSGCRRSARRASCSTPATSSRAGRTACSSAR